MTAVKRAPDRLGLLVLVAAAATVVCVAAAVAAMGLWRDDADLAALDRPLGVTELVAVVAGASAIAMIVIGGRRTAAVRQRADDGRARPLVARLRPAHRRDRRHR